MACAVSDVTDGEAVVGELALKERAPELKSLVLECTNLPPYQAAIKAARGWKIFSLQPGLRLRKVVDATLAKSASVSQVQNSSSSGHSP